MILGCPFPLTQPRIMSDLQADPVFYSSVMIEHIVPRSKELPFRRWHAELLHRARQFPGYIRTGLCPPLVCRDGMVKWYSVMHFDTPDHLNEWVQSSDRKDLVTAGQSFLQEYRFKSFTTGLEGWFSQASGTERPALGPAPWKQVLSVVLGLYPTVMIQSLVFGALGIMQDWPPGSAMLVNNLITSSILTWGVMPVVSRRLNFWLEPPYRRSPTQVNLQGAMLVGVALLLMMTVFNHVP